MTQNILSLDLETSGTDPEKHGIVEIAAVLYSDRQQHEQLVGKVGLPEEKQVDLGALKVNGRSYTGLKDHVYTINVSEVVDFFVKLPENTKILAHKSKFDLDFLEQYLWENNIEGLEQVTSKKVLDTFTIGSFLKEVGIIPEDQRLSLEAMSEYYRLDFNKEDLHSAVVDAKLTAELYFKMEDQLRGMKNVQ